MKAWTKRVFFLGIVRPLVLVIIGLSIRHRERLPDLSQPVILIANHNSHLDTLVLMSLFPLCRLPKIRPVAAADYFYKNHFLRWVATYCIDILPINRQAPDAAQALNRAIDEALARGETIIMYPEGTRGAPETLSGFKKGIAHVAHRHPEVPIIPIHLRGLGHVLPKGEAVFVPVFCNVTVGEPCVPKATLSETFTHIEGSIHDLAKETEHKAWD